MDKIIMLGVGAGDTFDLYNTCFVIQNQKGNFLVDTGGSIEIYRRLKKANIDLFSLKHIFISHNHTDHILGLIWLFKKLGIPALKGEIKEKINIYCNDVVYKSIIDVSNSVLPEKLVNGIFNTLEFHILKNNQQVEINNINYTFFDIEARGTKQFGFECKLNEKKIVFLGDEPLNNNLSEKVRNSDYVMHEAFCLDSEEHIFNAKLKNHSTVKSTCVVMNDLNVKNLILYHTEDTHKDNRQELYTSEGKQYFNGNIIVPNELEIIEIK